jgi:hypothetical protein
VDAVAAARAWAEAWELGWRTHDVERISARYADAAVFRSHPFREPEEPRAYVTRVFAEEEGEPEVWFGEPLTKGDGASVEYWAIVRSDGKEHTIAGHAKLRFDSGGLVTDELEYWAMDEGRRLPPRGWGA